MKTHFTVAIAMIAGFGLGAVATQGLKAQGKPPVYTVTEIEVTNIEAYTKEYAPLAQASIKNSGGKLLAAGQKMQLRVFRHFVRRIDAGKILDLAGYGSFIQTLWIA